MKVMVWLLGVMLILLGLEGRGLSPGNGTAMWLAIAVLWFLVGCIATTYTVARAALSKARAGALDSFKRAASTPPARKEE